MRGYEHRLDALRARLATFESLAVAFSGGVDSTVLLAVAHEVLGTRAAGLIADSPSLPRRDLAEARAFAASIGARLEVLATDELEDPRYRANRGDRCYFCRAALFEAMERWARGAGFAALAYGEITDDLAEVRPGRRAARESGIVAPLAEAGFSKADVRRYARERGLPAAEKAASACLASRLPVGTEVTRERLARIERAEERLRELGFSVLRVRDHGERARIEVGAAELEGARALVDELEARLAPLGFRELELAAYARPRG
jgi:uncharacterized protein